MKFILFIFLFGTVSGNGQLTIDRALVEYKINPRGVKIDHLRFGWELTSKDQDEYQTAYELGVATSQQNAAKSVFDVYRSGKIQSKKSILVSIPALKLSPGMKYFWKMRVWDKQDLRSAWSPIQNFTTGLFAQADWQGAQWIGYEELPDSLRTVPAVHAPYADQLGKKCLERSIIPRFRKEIQVSAKVKSALVFVSGLGQYELSINGKKIGDASLAPGWTHYDKRVLFNVFDVTDKLGAGKNAIGMMAGNGFYNINRERYFKMVDAFGFPKIICLLKITYEDGRTDNIISDTSWKTAASPVLFSSIYGGEDYDASLDQPGWDLPGFENLHWKQAIMVRPPEGKLLPEDDYAVTVMDSFRVRKITMPQDGKYVYDFGQNISGIIRIRVRGNRGQKIKLIPAELLDSGGLANQKASGQPFYFEYTCKGGADEYWQPSFTYYGFRYVQVENAVPSNGSSSSKVPRIVQITSLHTRNSNPLNGSFTCSNKLFNRIFDLINWAIKSNMQSVVTDCPHREKLSWIEQDHLMGASIHYNYDIYHLYRKLVFDLMDAQREDGLIPDIAPEYVEFEGGFRDSPEWGSAAVILPWLLYQWYGDDQIVADAYPMIRKYVDYLTAKAKSGNILDYGLGDWFDYGPSSPGEAQLTPKALTATAIYYYDVTLLARIAKLLGHEDDVRTYGALAGEVSSSFNKKFFRSNQKRYSTGSQTAMSMPYVVGLVDEADKKEIIAHLVDSIRANHYSLTAGDVGFHYLVKALDLGGASQVIFDMNNRNDVPGYGYQLKKGATALTESWPALEVVSNNHLMLGHIMEWFYSGLAGIEQEDQSVGYSDILIRPQFVKGIDSARARFHCPYGWITSQWTNQKGVISLNTSIPVNTRAKVLLPASMTSRVIVNGKPAGHVQLQNGTAELNIKSGNYIIKILDN